jgi:hypothetical protein
VHRDAVVGPVEAGDELDDVKVRIPVESVVESEDAVLATTPQKGNLPLCVAQ